MCELKVGRVEGREEKMYRGEGESEITIEREAMQENKRERDGKVEGEMRGEEGRGPERSVSNAESRVRVYKSRHNNNWSCY